MRIGKLNITWKTKKEYKPNGTIETIKTLGILEYRIKEILEKVNMNTQAIGRLEHRLNEFEKINLTGSSIEVKDDLRPKILELLKRSPNSAKYLRVELKCGSNRLYSALNSLLEDGLIVKVKKNKKIFYRIKH